MKLIYFILVSCLEVEGCYDDASLLTMHLRLFAIHMVEFTLERASYKRVEGRPS